MITRRAFLMASAAMVAVPPISERKSRFQVGVNLAGLEFKGHDFAPTEKELGYYRSKGITQIRLPFSWEKLQPHLHGDFDERYLALIERVVNDAARGGQGVLLDVHAYGHYRKVPFGKGEVTNGFVNLWDRLARRFAGHSGVVGYDLMNEPHAMPSPDAWPHAAQSAIQAIRRIDRKTPIYIEGDGWASAMGWLKNNRHLILDDPADNLIYSAHQYGDKHASGTYAPIDKGTPTVLVDRCIPFLNWVTDNRVRGHIGECGVPGRGDWLNSLDRLLAVLQQHDVPFDYWAGGPAWGKYPLSCEPSNGSDAPQMTVLSHYARR